MLFVYFLLQPIRIGKSFKNWVRNRFGLCITAIRANPMSVCLTAPAKVTHETQGTLSILLMDKPAITFMAFFFSFM